ncbi:MAG TPA: WD40 repeat domain-containing serine/threonine protein kinase, partial [Candidatus Binatia bacterium]|nr:WD40 repeat domain-containing serine/threonine protein kinase [Candidatus Binatia bacterium]
AHQRGVLHRDLKPSNVLLDQEHEPQVSDFGLARLTDEDSSLTLSQALIGTPAYLAPEVATGGARQATVAADIYGLGAILYQLLTVRPPFMGATVAETLRAVQDAEPARPRGLNPAVPADLETICLKCLEKDPVKRYGTAQALADDLGRYLNDEPIEARPVGPAGKAWRWCRRKPALASSLGVVLGLILVLGFGGPVAAYRINQERRKAETQAYTSDMNVVLQAWEEGNLKRAQALLRAHIPKLGHPDLRGFEWRYLHELCQDESRYAFTNFEHDVGALAFSPGGKLLAAGAGQVVKLLDINSGRELGELQYGDTNDDILCLAFSPRSTNVLATGGELGVIRLWNLATREITTLATHPSSVGSIAFSPDGKLLAAASHNLGNILTVWNVDLRQAVWTTNTYVPPNAVAFTPDGKALVSGGGGGNGNARVWDIATGKELPPFPELHKGWINYIAFSPDGRTLATCAADDRLILWDFADRRAKAPPLRHGGNTMAFSADGRLMASIGSDYVARVWDVASQQPVALLRSLAPAWGGLAFTPDSTRIVSAGGDRKVRLWDAMGLPDKDQLKGHDHWVHQVSFSPDGKKLASVDFYEGLIKLWDVSSRRFITDLPGNPGDRSAGGAAFSPNGKLLVTSSYSGTVMLWDTATLERRGVFTNDFGCACLAFSPGSDVLAVATGFMSSRVNIPRSLAFWNITTSQKINRLTEAAHDAGAVSFSNDGRLVAVGYYDGWVRL